MSTDAIDQCRLKVAVITAVDDQGSVWSTLLRTAFKMSTKKTTQKQVRALSGTVAELWNSLLLPSKESGSELVITKALKTLASSKTQKLGDLPGQTHSSIFPVRQVASLISVVHSVVFFFFTESIL